MTHNLLKTCKDLSPHRAAHVAYEKIGDDLNIFFLPWSRAYARVVNVRMTWNHVSCSLGRFRRMCLLRSYPG